jgi:hypothetical protein
VREGSGEEEGGDHTSNRGRDRMRYYLEMKHWNKILRSV